MYAKKDHFWPKLRQSSFLNFGSFFGPKFFKMGIFGGNSQFCWVSPSTFFQNFCSETGRTVPFFGPNDQKWLFLGCFLKKVHSKGGTFWTFPK